MNQQMFAVCQRIDAEFANVKTQVEKVDEFKPYRMKNLSKQRFYGRLAWISKEKLRKLRIEHLEITEMFQDKGACLSSALDYLHLRIMQLVDESGRFVAQEMLDTYRQQMDTLIGLMDELYLPNVLGKPFPNFLVLDKRLERLSLVARNNLRTQKPSFANDLELLDLLRYAEDGMSMADRQCRIMKKEGEYGTTTEVMENNLLVAKSRLKAARLALRLSSHSAPEKRCCSFA